MFTYYSLTHGWHGFFLAYGIIALFALAVLKRGQANGRHYLIWPITSLFTLFGVFVAMGVMWTITSHYRVTPSWPMQNLLSVIVMMVGGGFGGYRWATRGRVLAPARGRGAVVFDGGEAQKQTRTKSGRTLGMLTVAGVAVSYEDESKHFNFMGTTGSGKSTVMREFLDGALKRGDRAIVTDPDGGYLSRFYNPSRGEFILNPFDARSARWNLFAELKTPTTSSSWRGLSFRIEAPAIPLGRAMRARFQSMLRQAQIANITNLGELYRLLTAPKREELQIILEGTPAAPFGSGSSIGIPPRCMKREPESSSIASLIIVRASCHARLQRFDSGCDRRVVTGPAASNRQVNDASLGRLSEWAAQERSERVACCKAARSCWLQKALSRSRCSLIRGA